MEKEEQPAKERPKAKFIARSATDMQRIKLEKMMEHPEKPIIIPSMPKEKKLLSAIPTFVRNVMGSSAGAGSGEFHVYRHLRRKEYARQKHITHQSRQEELDDEYQNKIEMNRRDAEEKTAKKRAKRLKKKAQQKKARKGNQKLQQPEKSSSSSDDEEDSDAEEKEKSETINSSNNDDENKIPKSNDIEDSTKQPADNENGKKEPEQNTDPESKLNDEISNSTDDKQRISDKDENSPVTCISNEEIKDSN